MVQKTGVVTAVSDGSTTVRPVNEIEFPPGSVTDLGGGRAGVVFSGVGGNVTASGSFTVGHLVVANSTDGKQVVDGGAVPGGGAPTIIGDAGGSGTVASAGTITFYGLDITGTTPSGIVNATTITGAVGSGTAAGIGILLTGGADGGGGLGAGSVYGHGGLGSATAKAGYAYLFGGVDGGAGAGFAGIVAGHSATDSIPGGDAVVYAGSAFTGNANGGNVKLYPGAGRGSGDRGTVQVQNDPSLIILGRLSWRMGDSLDGMTIGTSSRAAIVTAVIIRIDAANGSAASLLAAKAVSGTTFSAGTNLTSDSADLTGTPATNQTLTLSTTQTDITLASGDSIGLVSTGTLALSAGCITVWGTPQ